MNSKTDQEFLQDDDEYCNAMRGDVGLALRARQLLGLQEQSEANENEEVGPGKTSVPVTGARTRVHELPDSKTNNRPKLIDIFFKGV